VWRARTGRPVMWKGRAVPAAQRAGVSDSTVNSDVSM
jgi:hypothetical protein